MGKGRCRDNRSRHWYYAWVMGALGLHLIMAVIVDWQMGLTPDEVDHLGYGQELLRFNPERDRKYKDSKMPLSVFNALPSGVAKVMSNRGWMPPVVKILRDIRLARLATIAASLLLAYFIARWSAELYGAWAGRFALLLYAFSPNILAHATLVTTDLYAALGAVVSSYFFFRFFKEPSLRTALIAALTLGLAQLAKFSTAYLFLFQFLLIVVLYAVGRHWSMRLPERRLLVAYGLLSIGLTLLVLQIGFVLHRPIIRLADMRFISRPFQALQTMPVLSRVPIPLPGPFVQGLDMTLQHEQTGASFGKIYLLGEPRNISRGDQPFYSYYVVCYLFKEPIALQFLLLMGLLWLLRHRSMPAFLMGEVHVVWPMLGYLLIFSYANKAQIGIRHILPALALALILASACFASWEVWGRRRRALFCLVLAYLVVSILSYFPHMIPYTNEFILDRKLAYKIFADSNLSLGQSKTRMQQFLQTHPDVILNPADMQPGRVLVSVNHLVGVFGPPDRYRWLREQYKPVAHVGYEYLLYEVGPW